MMMSVLRLVGCTIALIISQGISHADDLDAKKVDAMIDRLGLPN